jgi:hypothetical protein
MVVRTSGKTCFALILYIWRFSRFFSFPRVVGNEPTELELTSSIVMYLKSPSCRGNVPVVSNFLLKLRELTVPKRSELISELHATP